MQPEVMQLQEIRELLVELSYPRRDDARFVALLRFEVEHLAGEVENARMIVLAH